MKMMKINLNFDNLTKFDYDEVVINQIVKFFLATPEIKKKSCLANIKFNELSLDFVFCDDEFIHKINKEYRGYDKPTDVISFALYSDDENKINMQEINLGEIIVSIDTARKQAKKESHSLENEVYYLISHGILHLLGFDHQTDKEYNFMVDMQKKAMSEINYV